MMKLQNKKAVVSGGAGGIGHTVCTAFAEVGADVAIIDLAKAERTARKIVELGRKALTFRVDVSNFSDVDACMKKINAEFERIDILVNVAGRAQYVPFSKMTEQMWDRSIAYNLKGVFNCTRAVINYMIERRYGKIINISSLGGIIGTPTHVHYSAAKAGVIGMSKGLAKEVAKLGINVNVIAPGLIETPMIEKIGKKLRDELVQGVLVGRLGTPEDIASLTLFLASDEASYIVGQVISPNGGFYI
jgi:3-oxoacyl-[acyl-carrier protein] reductase